MPLIVRWPGRVRRGVSDALVSQVDLLTSFAALTGQRLAPADAPDSHEMTAALLGRSKAGRGQLVEQAGALSLRQGRWKYIEPNDRPKRNENTNTELGNDTAAQLYDLSDDPGETRNVAAKHPDKVKEMEALLQKIRRAGRSRP